MTIKLVEADIIRAAGKARDEGRLATQNPEVVKRNEDRCLYRYPGTNVVCAIGSGLTDEFVATLPHGRMLTIRQMAELHDVQIEGSLTTLCKLQSLHDEVLRDDFDREENLADFNRFLDAKLAELAA